MPAAVADEIEQWRLALVADLETTSLPHHQESGAGPALHAARMVVGADINLEGTLAESGYPRGTVRLVGTRVGRQFRAPRSAFINHAKGSAVHADQLQVEGNVYLDELCAYTREKRPALRLRYAHVQRSVTFRPQLIDYERHYTGPPGPESLLVNGGDGAALDMQGIVIEDGLVLTTLRCVSSCRFGTVQLRRATVRGDLDIAYSFVRNRLATVGDDAPHTYRPDLTVGTVDDIEPPIGVNRREVKVGGECRTNDTTTREKPVPGLETATPRRGRRPRRRSTKDRADLCLAAHADTAAERTPVSLEIDLRRATVLKLRTDPDAYCEHRMVVVTDCAYKDLRLTKRTDYKQWVLLLRYGTPRFEAQPYQQIADISRAKGHLNRWRYFMVEQQTARRQLVRPEPREHDDRLGRLRYLGGYRFFRRIRITGLLLMRSLMAYGYRPWLALLWLVPVVATTFLLVAVAAGVGGHSPDDKILGHATVAVPTSPTEYGRCNPGEQIGLALRIVVPLLANVTEGDCQFITSEERGAEFALGGFALQALSWITITVAAAGFTSTLRRS